MVAVCSVATRAVLAPRASARVSSKATPRAVLGRAAPRKASIGAPARETPRRRSKIDQRLNLLSFFCFPRNDERTKRSGRRRALPLTPSRSPQDVARRRRRRPRGLGRPQRQAQGASPLPRALAASVASRGWGVRPTRALVHPASRGRFHRGIDRPKPRARRRHCTARRSFFNNANSRRGDSRTIRTLVLTPPADRKSRTPSPRSGRTRTTSPRSLRWGCTASSASSPPTAC